MPRKAKSQPQRVVSGQPYGVAQEQRAAQKTIPLPDNRTLPPPGAAAPPSPAPGGMAPTPPASPPGAGGDPMADMMAAATGYTPQLTPLGAPSMRPGEPITAGAGFGEGPGPEAMGMPVPAARKSPLVKTLETMARTSRNPQIAELLATAQRRGQ